ncbi:VanZ family protein [Rhizobium tubonense]|uniref:VanZ family protein n=1 Tax=Rhizobium tubonense TaxID=484088 RepID=A0A2W4CXQ3_9HYPH|nr:VanZ family protein [Rhizobium tubonense]
MTTTRISRVLAWLLLAFIIFATVSPIGDRPHDYLPVQVDRALAFFLLSAFFVIASPRRWLIVGVLCIASAFVIEDLQYLSPSRDPDMADAVVKATGALLGVAAAHLGNVVRGRVKRHHV